MNKCKLESMTEPELRDLMNAVATAVMDKCRELWVEEPMMCLLLFSDPKVAQYICNCPRDTTIKAMRECADRLEKKEDVVR